MVRDRELFVGIINFSWALPQYLINAMLIGERRRTEYSFFALSCFTDHDAETASVFLEDFGLDEAVAYLFGALAIACFF